MTHFWVRFCSGFWHGNCFRSDCSSVILGFFFFFFNNVVYTGLDLTNLTKLFCYYLKTHRVLKICLEILRFKNSLFITPNIIITYFLEIMDTMGIVTNLSAIPFPMYILLACNDVTLFSDESFILKGTNHSIVLLLCVFVFNVQMFLINSKKQLEHICLNNVFFSKQRNQVEILKFNIQEHFQSIFLS